MSGPHRIDVSVRFQKYVSKPNANGCIIWTGHTVRGYGEIGLGGKFGRSIYAHRFAYIQAFGEIPKDMCVLHKCDVPACVNPAHLFLGTKTDNSADKVAKGRQSRGECAKSAKLNKNSVLKIRVAWESENVSMRCLARRFGVTFTTIWQVIHRRTWKHV